MKKIEQVLTEFAAMQLQLLFGCKPTFTELESYVGEHYWTVLIRKSVVSDRKVESSDSFEWKNYGELHDEEDEQNNLEGLEQFKKKFNLK